MGKVETRPFKRNWTTFVNPAFCAAWKSPPKMVVWNRPGGIWSQGCLFASPWWGKSKQGVLNAIGRPSTTRLFALLGKAHPKRWYETDLVEFDPKGVYSLRARWGKSKQGVLNAIGRPSSTRLFALLWKSPPKMVVWNRPGGIWSQGCLFRFAPMGKVETRRFERNWTTFVNPAFCAAWKSPPKMVVWNRSGWNSIPRGFIRLPPMGKVETRRFERNWTTFVNPAFCAAWKILPKMVVWNPPGGIWSQGCLFASRWWGKSKQGVLNAIGRPSSTRLFALLGKAHPKWWYETDLVEFDPKGVYSLRPDGESRNKAFWTQLDDLGQPGFLRCLEKPTQNGGMKPIWLNSIPRGFIRLPPMGKVETRRFERNWTTFVNPAFCAAWKILPKMVVWNPPGGIWSQGCLFASRWWGKSKQGVLNGIERPSSTRLFALLGKAHPKWWYETDLVEFDPKGVYSLRPDGESRNKAF